ncbi:hypothetical protein [Thermomonospora cellulosilytica]|uniref:Uncharacterized protein n=1 Tax=Thermomonospora cellulosilytica TaxID=1411118 RepID=A0A7W3N3V2_9ACTN|nr:hypothetical protein [Thermomonospora cellulosilytica]MBA9007071.1 hypothetical protein [Thermomonospora cellulosilytica]
MDAAGDPHDPHEVTARPVWRLLVRGIGLFLPEWGAPPQAPVPVDRSAVAPPVYLDPRTGFGLQLRLRGRLRGLQPDREVYVRGRQSPGYGIVIAGPAAAVGSRVVDAAALVRYARRLVFAELYDPADAAGMPAAVRAVRSVEAAVLLDRAGGVGLCAEVDRATGELRCPLAVRLDGTGGGVRAYAVGGRLAHSVNSHS